MDTQTVEITEEVLKQLAAVRYSGKSNMFETNNVQRVAYDFDLYALVNFIEESKQAKRGAGGSPYMQALHQMGERVEELEQAIQNEDPELWEQLTEDEEW